MFGAPTFIDSIGRQANRQSCSVGHPRELHPFMSPAGSVISSLVINKLMAERRFFVCVWESSDTRPRLSPPVVAGGKRFGSSRCIALGYTAARGADVRGRTSL